LIAEVGVEWLKEHYVHISRYCKIEGEIKALFDEISEIMGSEIAKICWKMTLLLANRK
jgi:hypothetical protein